eukprot:CAMPEP_0198358676 /NCGR_PEP_ID=MMETSP1450-20131203/131770_1 /TAXON_ID=753684 ORGANISM="Madagascaria erythrocladiodes, Strain CCMP3234" /NCGR_SAMPLE_ID=MMETSP1450 /ASSEMBLY_ACC=CAM_ASM_001115 /LENGTH=33 /DNA_ID= /DNA_START= /DNA_END= /DNA_ORIENTATION=
MSPKSPSPMASAGLKDLKGAEIGCVVSVEPSFA